MGGCLWWADVSLCFVGWVLGVVLDMPDFVGWWHCCGVVVGRYGKSGCGDLDLVRSPVLWYGL